MDTKKEVKSHEFYLVNFNSDKDRDKLIEEIKEIHYIIEVSKPVREEDNELYHINIKYEEDENMDERKCEIEEFINDYQ